MFFQPIVLDKSGYQFKKLNKIQYPMHWHSDLEIMYCTSGAFTVEGDDVSHKLAEGDCILIGSCEPHALSSKCAASGICISVGFAFFGEDFEQIRTLSFETPVLRDDPSIKEEIEAIAHLHESERTLASELEIRGRLYRLFALLLGGLTICETVRQRQQERLFSVSKIQKVLDYVAAHYNENVTVDDAATVAGYEKSSFCRSFKNATNATFHQYLNSYRMKKAKILLTESDKSIAQIAEHVGFSQHKNFCRLFKGTTGLSPSDYRHLYR